MQLLKSNAEKLGKDTNLLQTIEEAGEVIKAISKYRRTLGHGQKTEVSTEAAFADLLEEIADIEICIDQFIILNDVRDAIDAIRQVKLERTAKRYEHDKI